MGYNGEIIEKRFRSDGAELWLAVNNQEQKVLLLPKKIGRDKLRLEIVRALKELNPLSPKVTGYFGVNSVSFQDDLALLEFDYNEKLWNAWEEGKLERMTPKQTVEWLELCGVICQSMAQAELKFAGFHPADLASLGSEEVGIFDPRIREIFTVIDPPAPSVEAYLPPEVIRTKGWSESSYLYTAALVGYTMLGGEHPFYLGSSAETIHAVLEEAPVDLRYLAPETGERLAKLLRDLLVKDPSRRPTLEAVQREVSIICEDGPDATDEEQKVYTVKADSAVKKRENLHKIKRFWRVGRWGIAAVLILIAIIVFERPGYKPVIGTSTPPDQVVSLFYKAYRELDVLLLDETLAKGVGKDINTMVTWAYVISRYDPNGDIKTVLVLKDLEIMGVTKDENQAEYVANYTLERYTGKEERVQRRSDHLVLKPAKGIWRIISLDSKILNEDITLVDEAEP